MHTYIHAHTHIGLPGGSLSQHFAGAGAPMWTHVTPKVPGAAYEQEPCSARVPPLFQNASGPQQAMGADGCCLGTNSDAGGALEQVANS